MQRSNDDSASYERREKRPLKRNLTCQIKHFPMLLDRFHVFPSGVHKSVISKTTPKVTGQILVLAEHFNHLGLLSAPEPGSNHFNVLSGENLGGGTKKTSFFSKVSVGFHSVFCFSNQSCCNTAPNTPLAPVCPSPHRDPNALDSSRVLNCCWFTPPHNGHNIRGCSPLTYGEGDCCIKPGDGCRRG